MLVSKANREDPDQTASLELHKLIHALPKISI